jgi:hypothetical protein
VLGEYRGSARAEEEAKGECHCERVVELPGDGDEVGDEVEGKGEISEEDDDHELPASRDPRVGQQGAGRGRGSPG